MIEGPETPTAGRVSSEEMLRIIIDRDRRRVLHLGFGAFRNPADPEDVAQEVFIRIWERIQNGHNLTDTPTAWIIRVTINHIGDRLPTNWHRRIEPGAQAGHHTLVPSAEEEALRLLPASIYPIT